MEGKSIPCEGGCRCKCGCSRYSAAKVLPCPFSPCRLRWFKYPAHLSLATDYLDIITQRQRAWEPWAYSYRIGPKVGD